MHTAIPQTLPAVPAEMSVAIQQARSSIQQFLDAFAAPQPNQADFRLRVRFTGFAASGESAAEHLWLTQLDLTSDPPTGVIGTQPYLTGLDHGQCVPFLPDQVSDWMYVEGQQTIGAFTMRLHRTEATEYPQPSSRFTLLRDLWKL